MIIQEGVSGDADLTIYFEIVNISNDISTDTALDAWHLLLLYISFF